MGTLNNRDTSNTTSHNTAKISASGNSGGRPRAAKGKARTKTLSTKLSVAEWKIVMKRIADAGKRPSAYLREVLLSGRVIAARTQEDRQQIRMLEGGCNNLNQLARLAHQQGVPNVRERLLSLLDEFNRLLSRL
jgi:putative mobilization protein